jgi:hypothetical protein
MKNALYPEVSFDVNFHCSLDFSVAGIQKLLASHNTGIVNQDSNVTDLFLDLFM